MNPFKFIFCFFRGLWRSLRTGANVSGHTYIFNEYYRTNVFWRENSNKYRCSDLYDQKPGERYSIGAYVINGKCIYCGKKTQEWCSSALLADVIADMDIQEKHRL